MLVISRSDIKLVIVNKLPLPVAAESALEGRGLRGMRQRVELLGGAVDIGPTGDGWSVRERFRWATVTRHGGRRRVVGDMDGPDIAVLLVDDQDLVRSGLAGIPRRKDGFVIVAECTDGDEVPEAVAQQRPDVVVMDLRMQRVDGIEATRRLAGIGAPPVLALTTFNEDELLSAALRAGAAGFVLKDSSAEELIRAVRAVARGDSYLDPAVTSRVLTTYRRAAADKPSDGAVTQLTARELDVLRLIGKGRSNAEIADELSISEVTVKSHIGHIFVKLNLRDRAAAIVYAYDNGIAAPR